MGTGFLKTRAYSKRHYVLVMAFAIVLVVVAVIAQPYVSSYFSESSSELVVRYEQQPTSSSEYSRSTPSRIVIPKINLDTTFVQPLGLMPDKTVSVPESYTQVGWYSGGVSPGEVGPTVILGHVDSFEGPAVFYKLSKLEPGDEVQIAREDGTTAIFEVINTERYSQDAFPTELVYGKTNFAALRLVTCTGTFNKGKQRYSHNLVVYGKLVNK